MDFGVREVSQRRDLEILVQMGSGRARDDFSEPKTGTGTLDIPLWWDYIFPIRRDYVFPIRRDYVFPIRRIADRSKRYMVIKDKISANRSDGYMKDKIPGPGRARARR